MNPQESFVNTNFSPDSFWDRRRHVVRSNTLPFQLDMLRRTGRYDAFDLKYHPSYSDPPTVWPVPKHLFWESDVAKWIEGMSYISAQEKMKEIEGQAAVADLVSKIREAQRTDGYLNIHFTVVEPDKRWTNLRDLHELYNAGHLIEGALAHAMVYQSDDFLEPACKLADLLTATFGIRDDQLRGYPGHPEIELALIRLFKRTKNHAYLDLARYFIMERGNLTGVQGGHYYDWEAARRGESEQTPNYYPAPRSYWYHQAHKPIEEQETIEGHSVRAMYLFTAVADLALVDENFRLRYESPLKRLWRNMVEKKMYLTGGIGAIKQWEGFGIDYFLPQSTDEGGCYSETCAAIGVMMLAERMLQLDLDGKYADVMECCLYNSMLTGMSIDGRSFTYVNQLASSEGYPSKREEWFECACCPPNVARVLGHLSGYVYTAAEAGPAAVNVNVHLFASSTLEYTLEGSEGKTVRLIQKTKYPWDGEVDFELESDPGVDVTVRIRIPGWAESYEINPAPEGKHVKTGYVSLPTPYLKTYPRFRLSIPMTPRLIRPHPYTNQYIVALARGPVVYCLEDADHPWVGDHFKSLVLPLSSKRDEDIFLSELRMEEKDLPHGESFISITASETGSFLSFSMTPTSEGKFAGNTTNGVNNSNDRHQAQERDREGLDFPAWSSMVDWKKKKVDLHFIPYFARANRGGRGMMRVGIRIV